MTTARRQCGQTDPGTRGRGAPSSEEEEMATLKLVATEIYPIREIPPVRVGPPQPTGGPPDLGTVQVFLRPCPPEPSDRWRALWYLRACPRAEHLVLPRRLDLGGRRP